VQQTPSIRDLLLLVLKVVDQRLEVGVGEGCEIGQWFNSGLSSEGQ
jgi:hypothetical protein